MLLDPFKPNSSEEVVDVFGQEKMSVSSMNAVNSFDERKTNLPRRRKVATFVRPNPLEVVGLPKHKSTSHVDSIIFKTSPIDEADENKRKTSISLQDYSTDKNDMLSNEFKSLDLQDTAISDNILGSETSSIQTDKSGNEICHKCNEWLALDGEDIIKDEQVNHKTIKRLASYPRPNSLIRGHRTLTHSASHDTALCKATHKKSQIREEYKTYLYFKNFKNKSESSGNGSVRRYKRSMTMTESMSDSEGSGSFQSTLSCRSSSSSTLERRSTAGSRGSNPGSRRTGTACPQYFIPGENRGRKVIPMINIFDRSSVCFRGIPFKVIEDAPRIHRALALMGCLSFMIAAPSRHFCR